MSLSRKKLWQTAEYREKASKSMRAGASRKWRNTRLRSQLQEQLFVARMSRTKTSKPQISLLRRICGLGISGFKLEVPALRYLLDVADPKQKLAFEVDGAYWHSDPKIKRRDRIRDGRLRNLGWKVVRVSAKEVLSFDLWRYICQK